MDLLKEFTQPAPWLFSIFFIWSIFWKGFALWKAAKYDQRNWFIGILVLNAGGILELIYLFAFAKKKLTLGELKFWEPKK